MIKVTGGNVKTTGWQTTCGDWDHESGTAYLYHNGKLVTYKKATYSDHTLQKNNHKTYQVGYKGDSQNEFVAGDINLVAFYAGLVREPQV